MILCDLRLVERLGLFFSHIFHLFSVYILFLFRILLIVNVSLSLFSSFIFSFFPVGRDAKHM